MAGIGLCRRKPGGGAPGLPFRYAIRRQDVGIDANHPGASGVAYAIVKPGFRHQVSATGASAPGYGADSRRAPATAGPAQKRRESRNRRILSGDRDFAVLASPDLRGRRRPDSPGGKRRYGIRVAAPDTAGGGGFRDFDGNHCLSSFGAARKCRNRAAPGRAQDSRPAQG